MSPKKIYISSMGVISPAGEGISNLRSAIQNNDRMLSPVNIFKCIDSSGLLVGEVSVPLGDENLPRTHRLALNAARQIIEDCDVVPDAVVIGTTTGGMLTSENHFVDDANERDLFRYHSLHSVSQEVARFCKCKGPALTVSTACSSGAVAIKIAIEMLRSEKATTVLTGGVDSLCRLTYYGFKSLQLIDHNGSKPFDMNRKGMNVAEGAALLLLSVNKPERVYAEILGAGLSCDAFHAAKPHPDGDGAFRAMTSALNDAGITPNDIDYINLHGTGTYDNDLAEGRAINRLFTEKKPYMSSTKGLLGHGLAASGAIEAVVSVLAVSDGIIPANVGYETNDPEIDIEPVRIPLKYPVKTVLSNSFGFGGNNASIVIGAADMFEPQIKHSSNKPLTIIGGACLTGAGGIDETVNALNHFGKCDGVFPSDKLAVNFPPSGVRRLKRLPKMALTLSDSSISDYTMRCADSIEKPSAVFIGTGWGALSETDDFLKRLFSTNCQYPSPTSFVGSVHNSPGSQIAIEYHSNHSNVTACGADHSFEQALYIADILTSDFNDPFLVLGIDEAHSSLSSLFDGSVFYSKKLADGGGAFLLKRMEKQGHLKVTSIFFENSESNPDIIQRLILKLGGIDHINRAYDAIFAGIPMAASSIANKQLSMFLSLTHFKQPVLDYRKWIGEYASASATGAVIAGKMIEDNRIPAAVNNGHEYMIEKKRILLLGLGNYITAMDIYN